MTRRIFKCYFLALCGFLAAPALADDSLDADRERRAIIGMLKKLSPEELSEVETFNPEGGLAARKSRRLTDTDAALHVITGEDIRRAGITRLAEALRLVPGLQVAKVRANRWAISARGLNEEFAGKLLVMIDGRTVYSALRSEVNWDTQDLLMEDVERIEVIRGPGASLWGANAVNGIINIVTKAPRDTQGGLLSLLGGAGEENGIVGVRYGGELGGRGHYRAYGKFYQHRHSVDALGNAQESDWYQCQGGFRADWLSAAGDELRLQGDAYSGGEEYQDVVFSRAQPFPIVITQPIELHGFNLLGRWQRTLGDGDMALQTYYDQARRNAPYFDEFRGTLDVDFQHRKILGEHSELLWGLGYRFMYDDLPLHDEPGATRVGFDPQKRRDSLYSAFVQGEFTPAAHWRVTVGTKFEHNSYSGLEIQPSLRLLRSFGAAHSLWAAVSRAVRTPSRSDADIEIFNEAPGIDIVVQGNDAFKAEELLAYELGYRFNLPNRFLLDAALFFNDYDHLRTLEPVRFTPFPPTAVNRLDNRMYGEVFGLELSAHWQVSDTWQLVLGYAYLDNYLHLRADSRDIYSEALEGNSPRHQGSARSLWDIAPHWQLDAALYYTDDIPNQNVSAYTRADLRLAWQALPDLELSLGGRNLFDNQHLEFLGGESARGAYSVPREVERAWYVQARRRF